LKLAHTQVTIIHLLALTILQIDNHGN